MRTFRNIMAVFALLFLCLRVFPQGRIIEIEAADTLPAMNVYYPSSPCPEGGFPILYLFHGIRGNHDAWEENARVREVADSLIRAKAIEPVVIVMPYCFTRTGEEQINRIFTRYGDLRRGRFEARFPMLMAYVERRFPISADPRKRFIAGLSSGARQALNLVDTARCSVVGLLSPVLARREYPTPHENAPFYWIATGKGDGFRAETKHLARYLEKQGMAHHLEYVEGRHNWEVWGPVLPEFLQAVLGGRD